MLAVSTPWYASSMGRQSKNANTAYHHGNLSETLLQVGVDLIVEEGTVGLSLREVSRRAGVSTAAPYRHFKSREAMLAAIATEGYRMRTEATRIALRPHADDPLARVQEAGVAFVLFAHNNPAYYAAMSCAELRDTNKHPALAEAAAESMGILLEAIRASRNDGLVANADDRELAAVAWASVHGLSSLISTGQLASLGYDLKNVEKVARRITRTMLSSITSAVSQA